MLKDIASSPAKGMARWRLYAAYVLVVLLVAGVGGGGYYFGLQKGRNVPPDQAVSKSVDLSLFWKSWTLINSNYFGTTDTDKRVQGAIAGMVAGLHDPYTVYMEPSQSKLFKSDLAGSFSGIGAELEVRDSQLTVVAPLAGSPAEKAGIQAGDVILEIDGKKTADLSFNDAINSIRGDSGSIVKLGIARQEADALLTIPVTRDTIVIKSISTASLGTDQSIAYIKVNQFGSDTVALYNTALTSAINENKKSLILDLRNNPGGYLDSAVRMVGAVLPITISSDNDTLKRRVVVSEKGKDGKNTEDYQASASQIIASTLPIVVLVNEGSASASEIFAGAMKDYQRAKVVGTKTFGKGSVQELFDLGNGGSIKITIAKWFTPLGTGIDGTGVEPDVKVDLGAGEIISQTDAQVQKAISLLTNPTN